MKVLVTGAAGFTGRHVIRACLAAGYEVLATDLAPNPPAAGESHYHILDLCHAEALKQFCGQTQPHAAIHLAGKVGIRPDEDLALLYRANLMATLNLLTALAEKVPDCRVVTVGSAAQYGASVVRDQPVEESLPREPRTHYGHAKNVQEGVALQFAHEAKLEVVAARTFNIAGPGDRPWSVIPKTARACLEVAAGRTERVVLGNLESYRDIVDVRDAAQAYVALISGGSSGQAYNVCRGRAVLIREVVHRIAELCGLDASDIESRPASHAVAFDQPWIAGNNNKIKAATPWRPTISLDQTLRDVIADWQGKEAGT